MPAVTARRMLLAGQGLLDDPHRRCTRASLALLIEQLGFVQVDSINIVERAHHLTLLARLHNYRREQLAELLEHPSKRCMFEHWTHDASIIPLQWFSHWKHRFQRHHERVQRHAWWKARLGDDPQRIIDDVRQRIERDGPLLSRDFERASADSRNGSIEGAAELIKSPPEQVWWGWKPQKAALEHLWRTGELMIARRINFQKVYDLTERVVPEHHATPASEQPEHVDWACRSALERLGVATPRELAAYWNAITLEQARDWCAQRRAASEIVDVLVIPAQRDAKPLRSLAFANWMQQAQSLPEPPAGIRLLSPFDPIVRDRARTQRLFDFAYRFEAFTPAAQRVHGYYVLPMLERDRLVGRIDMKFHRDTGRLLVQGLWWEEAIAVNRARRARLDEALLRLATFVGAASIDRA